MGGMVYMPYIFANSNLFCIDLKTSVIFFTIIALRTLAKMYNEHIHIGQTFCAFAKFASSTLYYTSHPIRVVYSICNLWYAMHVCMYMQVGGYRNNGNIRHIMVCYKLTLRYTFLCCQIIYLDAIPTCPDMMHRAMHFFLLIFKVY